MNAKLRKFCQSAKSRHNKKKVISLYSDRTIICNAMARPIAETPVLYGADAQRFESIIQSTRPYPKEKKEQLRKTYEDFKRKVKITL